MSRTPARFTQAEHARAIRAAKQSGAAAVEVVIPGGATIRYLLSNGKLDTQSEPEQEVVL